MFRRSVPVVQLLIRTFPFRWIRDLGRFWRIQAPLSLFVSLAACSGTTTDSSEPFADGGDSSVDGTAETSVDPEGGLRTDAIPPSDGASDVVFGPDGGCGPNLTGVVRDFHDSHPDFERFEGTDHEIVGPLLGSDFKPVYKNAAGKSLTTSGKSNFDQWYRTTKDINVAIPYTLVLKPSTKPGVSSFDSDSFFPADGSGFGNEGREHNFHFTFELHTEFAYRGGEVFTFRGDDDVFTFINGHLAIDLGGVHVAQEGSVSLDEKAKEFGLEKGKTYGLSVFHAERHTTQSNFRIDTSISFTNCGPIIR